MFKGLGEQIHSWNYAVNSKKIKAKSVSFLVIQPILSIKKGKGFVMFSKHTIK